MQSNVQSLALSIYNVNGPTYLDDIKILPFRATSRAFVYEPKSFKLIAGFDNEHFGTIDQYSPKGDLVGKIKETVIGFRTLEEQQALLHFTWVG